MHELEFRIVRASEIGEPPVTGRKALLVHAFAEHFIDPDTHQPICVGEGLEVGPFDTVEQGRNWLKYLLPDTYKYLNIGKEKNPGGKLKAPFSRQVKLRNGKVYFLLTRVTE